LVWNGNSIIQDTMAELCKGKTVMRLVKITNIDVEKAMRDEPDTPAVPPPRCTARRTSCLY